MEYIATHTFLKNTVQDWLFSFAILLLSIIVINIFKRIVLKVLKSWSASTITKLDDFIVEIAENSLIPLAYVGGIYLALSPLTLSSKVQKGIEVIVLVIATFYILRMVTAVLRQFIYSFIQQQEDGDVKEKQARGLIIILNVAIWVIGIVFLIDNLGYNVTTLVAGLGIGGIAIALAAQAVLGDLFSYFVIFFDRPFEIGDFIIVDGKMGSVEYIGIKTTRLRSLTGEQLICSNTDLTNSRLHNYKRMDQRRVLFNLGIVYQSSYDIIKRVPEIVGAIIRSKPDVVFDRAHFSGFGEFSLNFEFVYYIVGADYNFYMDKQQEIYLEIIKSFEDAGIKFAYPTQNIIIDKEPLNIKIDNTSKL